MSMTSEQRKALDIQATCWVNASAGSGKTSLLVGRILRLLVSGVSGRLILCVTFTKRAALEMQERLDLYKHRWAACPIHDLEKELGDMLGYKPTPEECLQARALQHQAIKEAVAIQTFHSFCHDVLTRFPIESYLNMPLDVWDQAKTLGVWTKALEAVLDETDPESPVGKAIGRLVASGTRMALVLKEMFQQRLLPGVRAGSMPSVISVADRLKNTPNPLPKIDALAAGDQAWIELWQSADRGSAAYCGFIFQKFSKKTALRHPELQQWHDREYAWMRDTVQAKEDLKQAQHDDDVMLVFQQVLRRYTAMKGGSLDFDDLTLKTLDLLENSAYSGWVSHSFYHALHHILVDEAQDTSRHQWQILRYVIEAVMQHSDRTLCVVGDPKQSIYGFQGADPEGFFLMREFVKAWVLSVDGRFYDVELTVSFRSAPAILSLVNAVFSEKSRTDMPFSEHTSFYDQRSGVVEFWLDNEEKEGVCLAEKWTKRIQKWMNQPFFLPSKQRMLQAEDIMIVLPRRTTFFKNLQAQLYLSGLLKRKDMTYKDDPVLQMLVAWCRVVICPDDDMALAHWIEGMSVFGKEYWIFQAAYRRGKRSIWQNVMHMGDSQPFFAAMMGYIQNVRQAKRSQRMLDLVVDWVYGDGAWSFLSHWSTAGTPQNAIDAFIDALQKWHDPDDGVGFLDWVQKEDTVFKSAHTGGVQLLTIHGAKGAQAPVVIMPDLPMPIDKQDPEYWRLLYVALTRAQDRLYMSSRKENSLWYQAIQEAMHHNKATSGVSWDGIMMLQHTDPEAHQQAPSRVTDPVPDWETLPNAPPNVLPNAPASAASLELLPTTLPAAPSAAPKTGTFLWLIEGMRTQMWPALEQTDSSELGVHGPVQPVHKDRMKSYTYQRRGEALHQLLDELPNVSDQHWLDTAVRFLKRQGLGTQEIQDWAQRVVGLLHRPDLKPLFFQARAEVEWCGPKELRRMDRILMRPGHIWIVDFKSDHALSDQWYDSTYGSTYGVQMQRYVDLIQPLYPDHRVHQGILWLKHGSLSWHPQSHSWDHSAVESSC